jgi:hypothetical protein
MKKRRVGFAEVELTEFTAAAGSYRMRIGDRVELEVPREFDPEEVFALIVLVKEAEL